MSASDAVRRVVAPLGNLGGLIFPVGCLALLSVPGILFYQARHWLDTGRWPAVTVEDGLRWADLSIHHTGWAGGFFTRQFLDFPLSLALLAIIGLPLFGYAGFSKWLESRCERETAPHT